jgi:hypothetical protein
MPRGDVEGGAGAAAINLALAQHDAERIGVWPAGKTLQCESKCTQGARPVAAQAAAQVDPHTGRSLPERAFHADRLAGEAVQLQTPCHQRGAFGVGVARQV